jgi:hypothetical protein
MSSSMRHKIGKLTEEELYSKAARRMLSKIGAGREKPTKYLLDRITKGWKAINSGKSEVRHYKSLEDFDKTIG